MALRFRLSGESGAFSMDETKVYFGDALKALDENGKVGGYLVRFSDKKNTDLSGEWFNAETYLGARDGDGVDTTFHHGQPLPVKTASSTIKAQLSALSDHLFAPVKTTRDAIGIWAETVLDMADEYEAAVYGLVKAGKLGWSSGAVSHLVKVNSDGYIKRWPIGEAAITPTPCEPQNRAIPIKSLLEIAFKGFEVEPTEDTSEPSGLEADPSFDQAVSAATKFLKAMERNHENRVKEGRMLSTANRKKLQAHMESMSSIMAEMQSLLDASEPKPKMADPNLLRSLRLTLLREAA